MTAINYQQKKADLETWFAWHKESHPFWKTNREEYTKVCNVLKAQNNDNNRLSKEST